MAGQMDHDSNPDAPCIYGLSDYLYILMNNAHMQAGNVGR